MDYQVPMEVESKSLVQKEEVDNFDMQKVFMKDSSNEENASKKFARGLTKA